MTGALARSSNHHAPQLPSLANLLAGIPGFLFLLWTWRESGDYDTGARIRVENRIHAYVRQRGGEVMWYWYWQSPEIYNLTPRHDPLIEIIRERTPEDT